MSRRFSFFEIFSGALFGKFLLGLKDSYVER